MEVLGIDIGGSGIKGAPVDVTTGKLAQERFKVATPRPALPSSRTCAAVVRPSAHIISSAGWPVTVTTGVFALAIIRTWC